MNDRKVKSDANALKAFYGWSAVDEVLDVAVTAHDDVLRAIKQLQEAEHALIRVMESVEFIDNQMQEGDENVE